MCGASGVCCVSLCRTIYYCCSLPMLLYTFRSPPHRKNLSTIDPVSLFLSYFFRLSYGKKKVSEQINRNWIYVFRHYSLFSLTSAKIRISREQKQIFLHFAEAKYLTRSQRYEKTECKSEFFANDRNEAFKVHPNMKKTCRADVFSQKPLILLRENFGSHTRKLLSGTGYRRCLRAVAADDAFPASRRSPLRSFFATPLCVASEPEASGTLYP